MTAFGQTGPYSRRPGFGSLAEAMSGFAALTGEADGPPTLPPFGLADGIAALATSFAVMTALHSAAATRHEGQVIDMAIIEPIMMLLGGQITAFDQLGIVQQRVGNRSVNNAPRNVYRTGDGEWVAVSTSSQSIAERVMRLVGRPDLIDEPWFATGHQRAEHADELDDAVSSWIGARSTAEVIAAFEEAEAAVGPVYDVRGVLADPQYQAIGTIATVDDDELGPIKMQNVLFRMSDSPGRSAGPAARTAPTPTRCSARSATPTTRSPSSGPEASYEPRADHHVAVRARRPARAFRQGGGERRRSS